MAEERRVCYDSDLKIEAYQFQGLMQKFPNHFHDHYVVGFIESGKRHLSCKNRDYILVSGDMLLLNPRENHECEQVDERALDFRCLNIPEAVMESVMEEITGSRRLPEFSEPVAPQAEEALLLREVHEMIMEGSADFAKEEAFLFLIERVVGRYAQPAAGRPEAENAGVQRVRAFVDAHYAEPVSLDELAKAADMNKFVLLRAFTRERGITPYQYLLTVRINKAKELLERVAQPIEAAMSSGFTDQSHFTNAFKRFIGLTPGQYREIFREK